MPTRLQVPESLPFNGGEGMRHHNGIIYFATKGDNRILSYDTNGQSLRAIYDDDLFQTPTLTDVDNITVSSRGDVLVAEDGGDMQIVVIAQNGQVIPVLQVVGHDNSEITGPAFDPSGNRLYFSSQRGTTGAPEDGITFEVTDPFRA